MAAPLNAVVISFQMSASAIPAISLVETALGVHPAEARRIAAKIAKLLEEERGTNWKGSVGTVPSVKETRPSL